jgi:mevalonate pyrophosphate decarboxylase
MGALELRESVLEYINTADERLLKVVKAVIESYQENDIVAYTIEGKPLSRVAYKEELQEAIAEIKKGEYTSQEDLEKESNNW